MQKQLEDFGTICTNFGLEKGLISNLSKSEASRKIFLETIKVSKLEKGQKKIGNMLYSISTKLPVIVQKYRDMLASSIGNGDIYNPNQLDFAIQYLVKNQKEGGVNLQQFKVTCGLGVRHSEEEIRAIAQKQISTANENGIKTQYFLKFKSIIPYVEGKLLKDIFDNLWKEKGLPENIPDNKKKDKEKQKIKKDQEGTIKEEIFHIKDISELIGRQMKSAVNTKQTLQERNNKFGKVVLTRFPPQPNGYLHIGHCKAMRFNFMQAKTTNGHCYLRFDDTNPLKQNQQYIDNIKQNINFMGYQPWKVTHASDNFQILYQFAIQLIKQGDAFVCSESGDIIKKKRADGVPSKDRDRPIQQNLKLFQEMKLGMYAQGEYSLRAKINYQHPNTTLRDPVIYRIRYTGHPHVGDKWCIYPLYDYTHPLCDSLEGISHSLCSLQFQIRRELYYWPLQRLNLYKPNVWQYSRLNITNTVLSKRKLHELVFKNRVSGWDDPRILTINGMRRRGYPAQAINNFCDEIGVTRRGNQNYINFHVLENQVRKCLDVSSPRTMAVLDPVELIIEDVQDHNITIPFFPKAQEKGNRTIRFTSKLYVDRENVKLEDQPDFYGIAPNKIVGLKYAFSIFIKQVRSENGIVTSVLAQVDKKKTKPSAFLHWISTQDCMDSEVRVYGLLFTVEKPNDEDNYLDYLNKDSLTIYKTAKCHNQLLKTVKIGDNWQFQRKGFFSVDKDSQIQKGKIIWNLTVGLQDRKKK